MKCPICGTKMKKVKMQTFLLNETMRLRCPRCYHVEPYTNMKGRRK